MKLISVIGTRPQLIKASILSKQFSNDQLDHKIIDTGQHYAPELSNVFFRQLFDKDTNFVNLNINFKNEIDFYSKCFPALEDIFIKDNPDVVICYGDTNTSVIAALVASKMNIKLAHVESGLRDLSDIRPEEKNRIIVDRLSNFLFCPTPKAVKNLDEETKLYPGSKHFFTGDVMRDLFLKMKDKFSKPDIEIPEKFNLVTLHRQENVDNKENLENIVRSLNEISSEIPTIFPIHPRTKKMLDAYGLNLNCLQISPQGYLQFQWLLDKATNIITDSGGVQKESFFHSKKCLLIYKGNTGWTELEEKGFFEISKPIYNSIIEAFYKLQYNQKINNKDIDHIFGKGNACEIISNFFRSLKK
jgi:UDP-N-acetylglucosamine 2-epimerase